MMSKTADFCGELRGILGGEAISADDGYRAGVAFSVRVPMERLQEVAAACNAGGFYLETITALDFKDTKELVYHFNCYEPGSRFSLRVLCGHDETPPTISTIFASAGWLEREVHEFFGIQFAGSFDLRPLLLPEDAEFHPLRKTFGIVAAYRKRDEIYA